MLHGMSEEHALQPGVVWQPGEIERRARESAHGHRGATLWLTGLSGAGKSTIAARTEALLLQRHCFAYLLDGDNLRHGLNRDLGFSAEDRCESIRRAGCVAQLFTDAGAVVLAALISPFRRERDAVRAQLGADFIEVYVATPLAVCEQRDAKGLYRQARQGKLHEFTGIDSPYEAPEGAELTLHADQEDVEVCARRIIAYLEAEKILP